MIFRRYARMLFVPIASLIVLSAAAQSWKKDADAVLTKIGEEGRVVGMTASIAVDGGLAWSGAVGYADLENDVAATPAMVHRIASISKPITAVAVMQLVEQDKIKLTDTIQTHAWRYPEQEWPITVRQLLTHTSGIRHYNPGEAGTPVHYGHFKQAIKVFEDDPLLFEPGTGYNYSTYAYTVLGLIVEEASDQSFGDYLREHVFAPAGMTSSRLEVQGEIVPHRSRGYAIAPDGTPRNAVPDDLSIKYPGGGMMSTADDLVRFAIAFDEGKLVAASTRDQMLIPEKLRNGEEIGNGLGWGVGVHDTYGKVFRHSGGQAGTSTLLTCFPEHGIAIAVISNVENTGDITRKATVELAAAVARAMEPATP